MDDFTEQEKLQLVILGIIAQATLSRNYAGYAASWHIAVALRRFGYPQLLSIDMQPYSEACNALIEAGLVEELPDLAMRFRLKRRED